MDAFNGVEEAVLDYRRLNEICGGDKDFEKMLLESFIEDTIQRISLLRTALKVQDPQSWCRQAHAIKGTGANIGAIAISQHARRIETLDFPREMDAADRMIEELSRHCDTFRQTASTRGVLP